MKLKKVDPKLLMGLILTILGGYLDIYTFICRGNVFANVQTGNVVFLSMNMIEGDYSKALSYLWPIIAFILGAFASVLLKELLNTDILRYKRDIILLEAVILALAGLLPAEQNNFANMLISFACSVQVEIFGDYGGNKFFTIMSTGNLYNAAKWSCSYILKPHIKELKAASLRYILFVACFAAGGSLGTVFSMIWGRYAVLFTPIILTAVLLISGASFGIGRARAE